jgi:hypothetical protein
MPKVDPDFILTPEKLHTYAIKRLFRDNISKEELQSQTLVCPYIGFLPSELERVIAGNPLLPLPDAMQIDQKNGREPIYNHDGITYIPLSGESRMWRYLDMVRWTRDCIPNLPQIYGKRANIEFMPEYYGMTDGAAFRRFDELDWKLVNEVFLFKEQMATLKGIIFNSTNTVASVMARAGVAPDKILRSNERFSKEYLSYQFIPSGEGYILNFDYSYGSQVGAIIKNIAKIFNKRLKQDRWPKGGIMDLTIALFGKAGSIDSLIPKGKLVVPNSLITADEERKVHNEAIDLLPEAEIGPNFPQVSVVNQRRSELERGRKAGARIVEMEMMDAIEGIRFIERWHKDTLRPHFIYATVISDRPLEGETIESESLDEEESGYERIIAAFKEYFDLLRV